MNVERRHREVLSDCSKNMRKEALKNFSHFVTLCCGILTIETSDYFLRSFCFTGQNGAFSTTEQNGENFLVLLLNNSSSNPTATFLSGVNFACGKLLFNLHMILRSKNPTKLIFRGVFFII